jgi:hypothetical protein
VQPVNAVPLLPVKLINSLSMYTVPEFGNQNKSSALIGIVVWLLFIAADNLPL